MDWYHLDLEHHLYVGSHSRKAFDEYLCWAVFAGFFPLDLVKFGMRALVKMYNQKRGKGPQSLKVDQEGVPITRTQSRHESLYSNRTSFLKRAQRSVGLGGGKVSISQNELYAFLSYN